MEYRRTDIQAVVAPVALRAAAVARSRARHFLDWVAQGTGSLDASRIAVVVAHPDDEAVGLGGQFARLPGLTLVHVTDGAPRGGSDVADQGFVAPAEYAAARRREIEAAVALAGVPVDLVSLGIPDQEAGYRLAEIAGALAALFERREIDLVLTHPYEGGHPDHDATAFAVHAAGKLLARRGIEAPAVVEMASYFAAPENCVHQRFAPGGDQEVVVALDEPRRALKRAMLDAHATQAGCLWVFVDDEERFRPAPHYDFRALPNGGLLNYERFGWGMTGETWLSLTRAAMATLDRRAEAARRERRPAARVTRATVPAAWSRAAWLPPGIGGRNRAAASA
ncbi:MAG TPA: PIG-L family deacetylase [Beijerinckiaceae bacterium]|nr:PIG-L family deacetylase [Beijerinckiaceae bacterium]